MNVVGMATPAMTRGRKARSDPKTRASTTRAAMPANIVSTTTLLLPLRPPVCRIVAPVTWERRPGHRRPGQGLLELGRRSGVGVR